MQATIKFSQNFYLELLELRSQFVEAMAVFRQLALD